MKKIIFVLFTFAFICQHNALAWGNTGHRVVGEVAWKHMSKKARKNVQRVLGTESLAMSANWMDFIKSNSDYKKYSAWHYCTMHGETKYDTTKTPEEGDVVVAIKKLTAELKSGKYDVDEAFALKCLTHLIGDIHQPLHCGNGKDRGGNDIKVEFFYEPSNLHRVWDSGIIDKQQLSYTEYTTWVNVATKDQIARWQADPVEIWAAESAAFHTQIYDYPENGKLSYRYIYDNIEVLNLRLNQAGIRLAHVLNAIYG